MTSESPIDAAALAARLAERRRPGEVLVVGLTGSVASGKSTLARAIAESLAPAVRTEIVSTDGFLLSNARLDALGLGARKGFPESYDADAMLAMFAGIRSGPVVCPGYSHTIYDVDPALARTIEPPDILMVEGLGFSPLPDGRCAAQAVDVLVYLDATEEDLETWFLDRFMGLWQAAETDPLSFYAQFRTMNAEQAREFARSVWIGINLPNLREHISKAREIAGIVVVKDRNHNLSSPA